VKTGYPDGKANREIGRLIAYFPHQYLQLDYQVILDLMISPAAPIIQPPKSTSQANLIQATRLDAL
jgi:hypothetical protein